MRDVGCTYYSLTVVFDNTKDYGLNLSKKVFAWALKRVIVLVI